MRTYILKKQYFFSLITGILLTSLLGLFSCEDSDPDPEPELEEVLTEEGNFLPFEIAQLSLQGEKLGTGKIQGTLNSLQVPIRWTGNYTLT